MPTLPFIPFANCAEVIFEGFGNGHDAFITLGIQRTTPFLVPGDLDPLLDAMEQWWTDELSTLPTNVWTMPSIRAVSLNSSTAPAVQRFGLTPPAGTNGTNPVQDNVAMVVKFVTALRGRSYRGRNYLPFWDRSALSDPSHWSPTATGQAGLVYEALAALLEPIDCEHVVLSRYNDNTRRTTGVATPVTGYDARETIGTMRRRVMGYGS